MLCEHRIHFASQFFDRHILGCLHGGGISRSYNRQSSMAADNRHRGAQNTQGHEAIVRNKKGEILSLLQWKVLCKDCKNYTLRLQPANT